MLFAQAVFFIQFDTPQSKDGNFISKLIFSNKTLYINACGATFRKISSDKLKYL